MATSSLSDHLAPFVLFLGIAEDYYQPWYVKNCKIDGLSRHDPDYGKMDDHDEKVKNLVNLEELLKGRAGKHCDMYFDLVATHTTKVTGKAAYRKYRRKRMVSKLLSKLDEALAQVQIYNWWDSWMFEMPQDARAFVREGKKPNRRVRKYENAEDCPKAILSGKDEDVGGRFTGWRYRDSNRALKEHYKKVVEDRQNGKELEKEYVNKWQNEWRKSQKYPDRADPSDHDMAGGKSLEDINNGGYESNAVNYWATDEV